MIELGTDVANELTCMVTGGDACGEGKVHGRHWERGRANNGTEQETDKARKRSGHVPVDPLDHFNSIYAPAAAPVAGIPAEGVLKKQNECHTDGMQYRPTGIMTRRECLRIISEKPEGKYDDLKAARQLGNRV
jgi:hypothetical protein